MYTWEVKFTAMEGPSSFIFALGDVMGSNEIDCVQADRKTNVGKRPLQSKAGNP